jgi:hypothetical protein
MARTFTSKIDPWIAAIAIGPGLMVVPGVALLVWRGGQLTLGTGIMLGVTGLLVLAVPIWIFLSTSYEITDDTLRVRSGPLKQQVPLEDITNVTTTRTWESAPALSLRRIRITFASGRTVIVSPADDRGFLATLAHAGVEATRGVSPRD